MSAVHATLLLCTLQSLPHLALCFGGLFPVKVSIYPFFPKSGFNKMALLIEMDGKLVSFPCQVNTIHLLQMM